MPSKSKKQTQHHMSSGEKKERAQQKLINGYKRQQRWLMWAGIVILVLILFLLMVAWYSYGWGNDSTKDALKQNTPTTSTGTKSGTGTVSGTTGTSGNGGNGGSGGGGTSTTTGGGTTTTGTTDNNTNTSTEERSSSTNTSTTTNNSSTTNNSTTTNNNTTTQPSNGLLSVYSDTNVGETLDSLFNRVSGLGLSANCRIELVVVKVCDVAEGDNVVTIKALVTDNLITSITRNF